eukprot:gene24461-32912_t
MNNKCSKCTRFFVVNEKREVIDGVTRHVTCPSSSTKPTTSSCAGVCVTTTAGTAGFKEIILSSRKIAEKKTLSLSTDKTSSEQEIAASGNDSEGASKNISTVSSKESGKNLKEIIASRKTARRQSAALHEIERSQKVEDATALNKENWLEGLVAARRKERQDQERKHRECVVANDPQHRDYEVIMAEKKAEQESFEAFRRALSCHPGTYLERNWQRYATFERRLEYIRYQELFGWTCCLQAGRDDPGCVVSLPAASASSSSSSSTSSDGTVTLEEMYKRYKNNNSNTFVTTPTTSSTTMEEKK